MISGLLFSLVPALAQQGNLPVYKITVSYSSSLMPVNDRYVLELNGSERVTMDTGHKMVSFSKLFRTGEAFTVRQISVPRPSNFTTTGNPDSIATGIVGNTDVLITFFCTQAPLSLIKMNIMGVEAGETFKFSDKYNRSLATSFSTTINLGGFPVGDPLIITQTGGPRSCILNPSSGIVPNSPVTIQCDCRKNPGAGAASSTIQPKGTFTSPSGTKIVLRLNNTDTMAVTQTSGNGNSWLQTMNFSFPKSYPVGSDYFVSIKSGPESLGCNVYENAAGKISDSTFIRVRCDKTFDLVSRSSDNNILSTYYESFNPVIGGKGIDEGRYVAFGAYGKGINGSSGNYRQIFWRDRKTGDTKLISKSSGGGEANGNCQMAAISADGKTVAFESYATNLTGNDNNGARDVFVWDENSGLVKLVSKAISGTTANGESYEPSVSGDGSVIAYTSGANNIVTLDPVFSTPNVYVYNQNGSIDFITKDFETGKAASGYSPSISADGNRVAFCAYNNRLVIDDNNNLWDIFLWKRGIPGLKRISLTSTGGERNQGTESASRVVSPTISGNGRYISFATTATNMVPDDNNNAQDVFVVNVETGAVVRASVGANGTWGDGDSPAGQGEKIAIDHNGMWVAFTTKATNLGTMPDNIVMHKMMTGENKAITSIKGSSVGVPFMSSKGNYLVFGMGSRLDSRFASSGIFTMFTGITESPSGAEHTFNND